MPIISPVRVYLSFAIVSIFTYFFLKGKYFAEKLDINLPLGFQRPEMMKPHFAAQYATGLGQEFNSPDDIEPALTETEIEMREQLEKTNKLLEYDGQVLKFLVVQVNTLEPPYFPELGSNDVLANDGAKKYVLSFHLANDCIDIVQLIDTYMLPFILIKT